MSAIVNERDSGINDAPRDRFSPLQPHSSSLDRAIRPSSDIPRITRRDALKWGCALLLPGCRGLFTNDQATIENEVKSQLLKPIPPMLDGIRLDVFRIDRHAGDPRIGESMWKAVSQGGSLDPTTVRSLGENGFRFGTVPANPPIALQSLIISNSSKSSSSKSSERTIHESFAFPTGEHAILEIMQLPEGLEVVIPGPEGSRPLTLHSGKAVLRVFAEKIEDGWARLEIVPEIHHGDTLNRPVAGEREWLMGHTQAIEPLYQLKFHVELNRGEMAVIGLNDQIKSQLGRLFFRNQMEGALERVMMIRLADVFSVQAESSI